MSLNGNQESDKVKLVSEKKEPATASINRSHLQHFIYSQLKYEKKSTESKIYLLKFVIEFLKINKKLLYKYSINK